MLFTERFVGAGRLEVAASNAYTLVLVVQAMGGGNRGGRGGIEVCFAAFRVRKGSMLEHRVQVFEPRPPNASKRIRWMRRVDHLRGSAMSIAWRSAERAQYSARFFCSSSRSAIAFLSAWRQTRANQAIFSSAVGAGFSLSTSDGAGQGDQHRQEQQAHARMTAEPVVGVQDPVHASPPSRGGSYSGPIIVPSDSP